MATFGNSALNARPYSLSGQEFAKPFYNLVTGIVTIGGPMKIPRLLPHGPNFFAAYQWTRNQTEQDETGLVPTDAERTGDLATWHEMLIDRFVGTPEDDLLDRLVASPALAGPELNFLRARIAERRGDLSQAATLVTSCLQELPGHQAYLDFAVEIGAELPPRAREIAAERARAAGYARTT